MICPKCNGEGSIKTRHEHFTGTVATYEDCKECKGIGEVDVNK